mgnify:CR=1 FL=1
MKKFLSVSAVSLFLCAAVPAFGYVIAPEVAKTTADKLLSLDSDFVGAGEATVTTVAEDGTPAYYVIEYNAGGWAIVSAQSSSKPLIAYNPTGKYEVPEPMQAVLDANKQRIVAEAENNADYQHIGWSRAAQRKPAAEPVSTPDVAPLIKVNLNQSAPFNDQCPTVSGQHVLVGCVAVGMGQAMMVARYPERPVGSYSYTDATVGYLSIDYDAQQPYDWNAMYAAETTGNYSEIARLLYHCGVSVRMQYGIDGSGAYSVDIAPALTRNFQYDSELIRYVRKSNYSREEWISLLLDELVLGRAVIYGGDNGEAGHCWNVDGWKQATQMFHVNWGWGGYGNSYFDIEAMEDQYQGMSFPYNNDAIVGVGAPTTAPYGLNLSTTSIPLGAAAGVALADVVVLCEDESAVFSFTVEGPEGLFGRVASPYRVENMKLVSTETITDAAKFKYALITVTNTATGESLTREFTLQLNSGGSVASVFSNAMRVYPAIAYDYITVEVPATGGSYAIYSMTGALVDEGRMDDYKTQISVSSLPAGAYLLKYVHPEGAGVKNFIVK